MPINILFWVIYIVSVFFGGWLYYDGQPLWYRRFGGYIVLWVLVGMLGWRVFGPAIR